MVIKASLVFADKVSSVAETLGISLVFSRVIE